MFRKRIKIIPAAAIHNIGHQHSIRMKSSYMDIIILQYTDIKLKVMADYFILISGK